MLALKELFIVLILALVVFKYLRPTSLHFTNPDDFSRRRNAWCAVTIAAFLCPSFWLFCLVAMPFLIAAGRKDSNPGALYLMLMYVVPGFSWRVPMVGMSYLIDLDFQLLLSFCVAVPAALRLLKAKERPTRLGMMDYCLLAYLALTSMFFILPEIARGVLMTPTLTDSLRRAFESFFGIYVPYFVISRSSASRREVQDILMAFCLSCAVMAAIGTLEGAKHWLLYGEIRSQWGPIYNPYLMRGESVRAMASTIHPLVFGYLLAIAFGLWLCIKPYVQSKYMRNGVIALYWLGLLAAYSRGPWLGAVLIYFIYVALSGRPVSNLLKATGASVLVGLIVAITPLGEKIASVIPYFGGTVDLENITYRQRLLDRAWQIIQDSPFLGDQYALSKMEDLRQGQGIIDLMNGFVNILLDNGFVGLLLFMSFILIGTTKAWMLSRERALVGTEIGTVGASLVACILGTLVMIWVGGLIVSTTCILVGLAAASADVSRLPHRETSGTLRHRAI
jgi:O-Antigen ligase